MPNGVTGPFGVVNPEHHLAVEPPHRAADGVWVLSRYADVRAVLRAPNVGIDPTLRDGIARLAARSGRDLSGLMRGHGALPNMRDGAEHAAARRAFACHAARLLASGGRDLEPRLDETLQGLPCDTPVEAMRALILPLVDGHLAETLGIGMAELQRQKGLFSTLFEGGGPIRSLTDTVALSAMADLLFAEATAILNRRGLAQPDTADLGALIFAVNLAGDAQSGLCAQILFQLAADPGLVARLRADPALTEGFVRECLRFSTVVPLLLRKVLSGRIDLPDAVLSAGDRVRLDLWRANRDPAVFADPDRFLPDRRAQPHLAFAAGPHTCQGARAGKGLAETFTRHLVAHFDLAAGCDRLTYLPGRLTRIPDRLPVTFRPRFRPRPA